MKTITVDKRDLLIKLRANRDEHAAKVLEARTVYRRKIIEELDHRLSEAKTGADIDPGFLHRLPIPRDFTEEYDRTIDQLEWETSEQIQLTPEEFNRFVRDEWEWRQAFVTSTQSYT